MTLIRQAVMEDMPAITAIYAWNTLNGTGTFALEPLSEAEMTARFHEITAMRLPYLVAESDAEVVGFAYAAPFRSRPGYKHGVEDSLYLAPGHTGKGIGKALLSRLIDLSAERGIYMMYAVIGDAANAASIGVHRSCGFEDTGRLPKAGYKFDRWLDVVFMARELRPLDTPAIGEGWAGSAA